MAPLRRELLLSALLGGTGLGCVDGSAPTFASVTVFTATEGAGTDRDGYTLRIDLDRHEAIGTTDTLVIADLPPGQHQVSLQGVDARCTLGGDASRNVTASAAEDAVVRFEVSCAGTGGTLRIATTTRGADLDPSGYLVVLDDGRTLGVGASALISTSLPVGAHEVELEGIAANCVLNGPAMRIAEVVGGGTARLDYEVRCSATQPAGRGHEIAFVRRTKNEEFGSTGRLHLMNEDGTSVRDLPGISGSSLRSPEWLADGVHLGFLAEDEFCDPPCGTAYVLDLGVGIPQPLPLNDLEAATVRWSPDGSRIAYGLGFCDERCGSQVVLAEADGSDSEFIFSDSLDYLGPAWLPDGTAVVYLRSMDRLLEIVIRGIAGSAETAVSRNLAGIFSGVSGLAVSPEGTRMAFSALPAGSGPGRFRQIYQMRMDGGDAVALTDGDSNNFDPAWSPDARFITFVSDRDGNEEIYVMESAGTNPVRITNDPAADGHPTWRP